ncbi:hypothetical protein EDC39_101207 [Geothermobacter ehrlichii]|uniref:Nucleoside-diphosphate sugar epimerase n=1 Tax=Geothermobacter ehrlichii TaxID=213224 RepID=A0A5D3WPA7_9BACT|nr:ELM1/GtrOC1 family putative glycosyltransferase [Geothermobacter ehrlichii]TYP00047.1 hypothetical protein EDC39_101207 [Geothermobacter ehrlichii]
MKPGRSESDGLPLLILSDGRPGHVNQSVAFARHLGRDYRLCRVRFRSRWAKGLSYLLDRCGIETAALFDHDEVTGPFAAVVSAGSDTYYANRGLARHLGCKSVAIMLPRGYRLGFDLIVAQEHDNPPRRSNLISLPVNLSWVEPAGHVRPDGEGGIVSVIVGGVSKRGRIDPARLEGQVRKIFDHFPGQTIWLTTSRRTSPAVEAMLRRFPFAYAVFYSERQINPIPDFLLHSDYVFLTDDSTSMISEAVSWGRSRVEILPSADGLPAGKPGRFLRRLQQGGYLHLFEGEPGCADRKVDLRAMLSEVAL